MANRQDHPFLSNSEWAILCAQEKINQEPGFEICLHRSDGKFDQVYTSDEDLINDLDLYLKGGDTVIGIRRI